MEKFGPRKLSPQATRVSVPLMHEPDFVVSSSHSMGSSSSEHLRWFPGEDRHKRCRLVFPCPASFRKSSVTSQALTSIVAVRALRSGRPVTSKSYEAQHGFHSQPSPTGGGVARHPYPTDDGRCAARTVKSCPASELDPSVGTKNERVFGGSSRARSMRSTGNRHRPNFLILHQAKCSSSFGASPEYRCDPAARPWLRHRIQWQPIERSAVRRRVVRPRTPPVPKLLLLSSPWGICIISPRKTAKNVIKWSGCTSGLALAGTAATLRNFIPSRFIELPDLGRTAFDACQSYDLRARLGSGRRRVLTEVSFKRATPVVQFAHRPLKGHEF